MIISGYLVRRVILSNVLASYRRVSSTVFRSTFRTLPAIQIETSKLNANVSLVKWQSVICCRLLQTTSFLAHRESSGLYFGVKTLRTQDTSDPRHFGTIRLVPKCPDSSAPVPKCLWLKISHQCLVPNYLDL